MKRIILLSMLMFVILLSGVNAEILEIWSQSVQTAGFSSLATSNSVVNESNRIWIQSASINNSATKISFLLSNTLSGTGPLITEGMSICKKNATVMACEPGTLERVYMNGSSSWNVSKGGYNWTDWINYTIDSAEDYYVTTYAENIYYADYFNGASTNSYVWKFPDPNPNKSQVEDWASEPGGGDLAAKDYFFGGVLKIRLESAIDITDPVFSLNSLNNSEPNQRDGVQFNITINDTSLSSCIFSWDNGTGTFSNITTIPMSGTSQVCSINQSIDRIVGTTMQWKYYANDTANNWAESSTYNLLVQEPSLTYDIWAAAPQVGGALATSTSSLNESNRAWIKNAYINGSAVQISILISNTMASNNTHIDGLSICEKDGTQSCVPGTLTRITMNGESTWQVGGGGYNWTDWMFYTIDPTKDYFITSYHGNYSWMDYYGGSGTHEYFWRGVSDKSQVYDWGTSGTSAPYLFGGILKIKAKGLTAQIDNCTLTGSYPTINFTLINETTDAVINSSQSFSMAFAFKYYVVGGGGTRSYNNYSKSTTYTNYSFCITPNTSSVISNITSEFIVAGVYYTYEAFNMNLSNATKVISLYAVDGTSSVTFNVKDTFDNNIKDAYITIQKYDIGTNTFKTTEILRTDNGGNTIGRIVLNTIWYRFLVNYHGITYLIDGPTKVISSPKYLRINLIGGDWFDNYDVYKGVSYNLSFNNGTKNFKFEWNDPNSDITSACLLVVSKNATTGIRELADTCTSAANGIILINIAGNGTTDQTYLGTAYIIVSGDEYIVDVLEISFATDWNIFTKNGEQLGIFLTFMLVVTLLLLGVWHPAPAIMLMLLGLGAMRVIGIYFISWPMYITLIILGVVVVVRISGQR